MKKIYALLIIMMVFMSACQPTPEEPVIQSKDGDLVQQVVDASSEENQDELQEDKEVIQEQIEAINEYFNMEFQINDRVNVVVDAEVSVPAYEKIPMVRVKPENFTTEHLQILIDEVFGDNTVYFQGNGVSIWSKEEAEEILVSLRAFNQNDNLKPHIKSHLEKSINSMERFHASSPKREEEEIYDGTLIPVENSSRYLSMIDVKCYLGRTQAAQINMTQTGNKADGQLWLRNQDYGVVYNTFEQYEGIDADKIDVPYEECKQAAIDLVKALDGMDTNMTLFSSGIGYSIGFFADYTKETSPQCYIFTFAREYNGVLVKPVGIFSQSDSIDYSSRISTESINIKIDNEGIWSVNWGDLTQYTETLAEDMPLMDFESINEVFKDYCEYKFSWVPTGNDVPEDMTVTININEVELNLMMTPEKDNLESYIMIPVWDYIGDIDYDEPYVGQDGYTYDGQKNVAILTINAIDGTVIDREQGY
jgi:hypothetical protein